MQSGNGIDLPAVYQLLQEVVRRVGGVEATLDGHTQKLNELTSMVNEHTRILNEHTRILNAHDRKIDDITASLSELRTAVSGYHQAVISQGIHYSELDGRVRRIERHLKLEPNGG